MTDNGFKRDKMIISGTSVPVEMGDVKHAELKFYAENPRIYTILNAAEEEPSQAVIQSRLEKMDHVKKLINSIRSNGGLTDALIVRKGDMVVLEGNSRLAAYRVLARTTGGAKWSHVPCKVLPRDIDEGLIFSLLGQYHIIGRKDWAPYEQAGYMFRRVTNHNVSSEQISKELGLSVKMVNHLISVYSFMREHGENEVGRWSYYEEYLSRRPTKRAREQFPDLDKVIVKKIRSGEIERATDIRDKVAKVCAAGGKTLSGFVAGKQDLHNAAENANRRGASDVHFKRLKKFQEQVGDPALKRDILEMTADLRKKCVFTLKKISQETTRLHRELQ